MLGTIQLELAFGLRVIWQNCTSYYFDRWVLVNE